MKKYKIWIILAVMALCAMSWRFGFNQARKMAQLVDVNENEYTIVYGDFIDIYEREGIR